MLIDGLHNGRTTPFQADAAGRLLVANADAAPPAGWSEQNGWLHYAANLTAGVPLVVFLPSTYRPFGIRVIPGSGGTVTAETSLEDVATIQGGTAADWEALGDPAAVVTTYALMSGAVALRVTATGAAGRVLVVA